MRITTFVVGLLGATLASCGQETTRLEPTGTDATTFTAERNRRVAESLDLADRRAFADAERGLVAAADPREVSYPNGDNPARTLAEFAFLEGEAPDTVNPSLWRQARLNNRAGLYEVAPGIHQLRGFDLANMTLIEGQKGWIVVDPLTTEATARDALAFARRHLGDRAVTGVVFTHSHADHFGGVLGVLSAEEAAERGVPIVAPVGFLDAATRENLLAGPAMIRRVGFVYGRSLGLGPQGNVGIGLGKALGVGKAGVLPPTREVTATGETLMLDGVPFVFQLALGSEAPAEFTFYLPQQHAFCGAEVVSMNMHNVYTLRGAKVRDALAWSGYIDEAIGLFPEAEVYFGSHHWPVWGREGVVDFLKGQRDLYKYIHDQTLRLANQGLTPREIAEELELPEALTRRFDLRGYYGSVRHNAKAVYQFYFGWYDGNPAHLDPLPPEEAARRYVALAGGAPPLLASAQQSYDAGDYRWAAELLNHLVFAEPAHTEARRLLAASYRQLGYAAESTQWRNSYLVAAHELETGPPEGAGALARNQRAVLMNTPLEAFFDAMAVNLDGPKAAEAELALNVVFSDLGESFVLDVENGVLHHRRGGPSPDADATLEITHGLFVDLIIRNVGVRETLFSDELSLSGSRLDAVRFFRLFSPAEGSFAIVTP
jgi:alkyl sulfatase BDS1-like metallo-beta-lactamase superfamily hydrolase